MFNKKIQKKLKHSNTYVRLETFCTCRSISKLTNSDTFKKKHTEEKGFGQQQKQTNKLLYFRKENKWADEIYFLPIKFSGIRCEWILVSSNTINKLVQVKKKFRDGKNSKNELNEKRK